MNYAAFRTLVAQRLPLWNLDDTVLTLLDHSYAEMTTADEVPLDYPAFGDADRGPSLGYAGSEIEDGIFNFVVHLTQQYSQTMTPAMARLRVAQWLEEMAQGLRAFSAGDDTTAPQGDEHGS